ncbi:MAG: DUF4278 domain-containing protein [Xenococcus sp. MO_188.B8]|nr:DUF4278 domain-containing protein [Xenococcus sp. MO_188.B8]
MKLTYRGVQYSDKNPKLATPETVIGNKDIVYRGNSLKERINPQFPWLKYLTQLFSKPESKPVFDPITFWYNHKRKFIENCWHVEDLEKLDRCWDVTLQIEQLQALKQKQKIKLKYRGVTYYR